MKKLLLPAILLIFSFLFLNASEVDAKIYYEEKGSVEIRENEIINDDVFIGAESVFIDGTINGDVYAGAESVTVRGTINGDLHAGAGKIHISGTVTDDVYAGAGNITLSKAAIGGSFLAGAGNLNIDETSSIKGSLITGAGNLGLYSPVGKDLMIGAGTVDMNSAVGGDVRVGAGSISVGPDTKVGRDFYYALSEENKELSIPASASISGNLKRFNTEFTGREEVEKAKQGFGKAFRAFNYLAALISLLGAILVGYLWLRYLPKSLNASQKYLNESLLKSTAIGFIVSAVAIPLLIFLFITGVGIPLSGILFLVFLLGLYLAKIVTGLWFGEWIYGKFNWKKTSPLKVLAVGLLGLYIIKAIPVLGFFASVFIIWTGLGGLFQYVKSSVSSKTK